MRRLIRAGAGPCDIGQGDVPWEVLTDPEGNRFCVLEPRPLYRGTGAIAAVVVGCPDTAADAEIRFWATALSVEVDTAPGYPVLRLPEGPMLEFVPAPDAPPGPRVRLGLATGADGPGLPEMLAAGAVATAAVEYTLRDPAGHAFRVARRPPPAPRRRHRRRRGTTAATD